MPMARHRCFRVEPRDGSPKIAAERLGISLDDFNAVLPNLYERGFPKPDPDTGNFDLKAIEKWCDARHPRLFGSATGMNALDASTVARERIEAMRRGA
jgi:hypothetical protein